MTTASDSPAAHLGDPLACLAARDAPSRPVHLVRPEGLAAFRDGAGDDARSFLDGCGFDAAPGRLAVLPDASGGFGSVAVGIGDRRGVDATGGLAALLPPGTWHFAPAAFASAELAPADALLGFCLGADVARPAREADVARPPRDVDDAGPARVAEDARFARGADDGRSASGAGEGDRAARLVPPPHDDDAVATALDTARAIRFGRALVNRPANLLGPSELADEAERLASRHGARVRRIEGDALARGYPAIHAVGAGSDRPPVVAILSWAGSGAGADAPLLSLAGKGVCFDTGGYDLKPSAGMLRMKKDMGGAAVVLALASLVMARDLPIRLSVRIGCVENSVSGRAMRPSDVVATRAGLRVEVNNTDAEGRLVLADLLACAGDERPDVLLDVATLTGAARVALGPDLPALFTDDENLASALLGAGAAAMDPMWRLPLWSPYDGWLESRSADLANVSAKPMAGAVTAALFLRRFAPPGARWAHLDAYCWNDRTAPARPEGGEVPLVRALHVLAMRLCETGTV